MKIADNYSNKDQRKLLAFRMSKGKDKVLRKII